jgi:hypothetical protein
MRMDGVVLGFLGLMTASVLQPTGHARPSAGKGTMSERAGVDAPFEEVSYVQRGGFSVGRGDLRESEILLTVDLVTGAGALTQHQPSSDNEEEPLGTFRAVLPADLLAEIQAQLASFSRHPIVPGPLDGPGRSDVIVRAKRPGHDLKIGISTGDMKNLDRLSPLLSVLEKAVAAVHQHPHQAIRLEIQTNPGPDLSFTITVRNIGTEPVAIPDLATLRQESASDTDEHGIGVRILRVPPDPPGNREPPYVPWSRVEVVGDDDGSGKPIELQPGAGRSFKTAVWSDKRPPSPLVAQAFLSFYRPPAAVKGPHPYLIRGLAVSKVEHLNR